MPAGRILLKSISESKKLSRLKTDSARLLYTWLIPHLDINGCFSGDAQVIKGKVLTRLRKTTKTVEGYLEDLEENGLIIRYEVNGDSFLYSPDFSDKQPSLNPKREAEPSIPLPTPDLIRINSDTSKVKESKGEVKEKGKKTAKPSGFCNTCLTLFLINGILTYDEKAKVPKIGTDNFNNWADQIRLMRTADKRDLKFIFNIIRFSQNDDFWRGVVLSTSSLRRNQTKLFHQSKKFFEKESELNIGRQ